ncbi:MAG: hypothetical protein ABJF07_22765, partial [Nisaea sp.]|uniref:hypothetical protein n=1 Tax=Nisaea sp. TaxID=2024842 RepID=UPI00326368C1
MTEADRTADNALGRLLILVLAAALCVLILDRTPIANGFSVLPGDRYDGVIASVILEHWYSVFTGQTPWTEVGYFYPYTHTLAQTDSHLINGLLYIPFRATGLDPFLSAHLSKLPLRLFGFFAFYALCRKYKVSFGWAAVAAALFTLSNAVTSHGSRLQLASIAVAPFMAILVWNTLAGIINQNSRAVLMWGSAAGFTFGLWCMTTFYMAWSFFYLFLVWGAVLVIWAGRDRLLVFWFATCKVWPALVAVVVVAAASIAPFAYIYLPKAAETGIRSFDDAWMFTVLPVEIIQVGVQNILFGDITQAIIKRINPAYVATGEYSNTGPNIALAFLLLAAVISAIYADRSSWRSLGFAALALATVITWATTIRIGHTSLWLLVYHTIPGAKALRVVSIHQMFLIGPML